MESIVKQARGRRPNPAFEEGVRLLNDMIQSQSKLYDTVVFDTPKTSLEQMRNLNLMLDTLVQMSR